MTKEEGEAYAESIKADFVTTSIYNADEIKNGIVTFCADVVKELSVDIAKSDADEEEEEETVQSSGCCTIC